MGQGWVPLPRPVRVKPQPFPLLSRQPGPRASTLRPLVSGAEGLAWVAVAGQDCAQQGAQKSPGAPLLGGR